MQEDNLHGEGTTYRYKNTRGPSEPRASADPNGKPEHVSLTLWSPRLVRPERTNRTALRLAHARVRRLHPRSKRARVQISFAGLLCVVCSVRRPTVMEQNGLRRYLILGRVRTPQISQARHLTRRAECFIRWTRKVAQARHINISTFEEGLGQSDVCGRCA